MHNEIQKIRVIAINDESGRDAVHEHTLFEYSEWLVRMVRLGYRVRDLKTYFSIEMPVGVDENGETEIYHTHFLVHKY